jgi:hypothetical protein
MQESLYEIDKSYWKTGDKQWMAKRIAFWPKVEFMLSRYLRTKKTLNVVKQYYLKGKMPNWTALRSPGNPDSHLDLFNFLWLHPSRDEDYLTELRNLYIHSDLVMYEDVVNGFMHFFESQAIGTTGVFASMDDVNYPFLDGNGELMFRILVGNDVDAEYELAAYSLLPKKKTYKLPKFGLSEIALMGEWLAIETMLPFNEDYLYQFDLPLDIWCKKAERVDRCNMDFMHPNQLPYLEQAFYRICYFDTEKEGDTCRSRFAHKVRKIFDEREFIPEFKQMWRDVSGGRIVVDNAWES